MQKIIYPRLAGIFTAVCLLAFAQSLSAQATLSIQGIIRKSNGAAVGDGKYDLTFKLYNATSGGTALHTETQKISVVGGIYSAELGSGSTPLNAAFDQTYYLGVSVDGGAELVPRARLTSSPYALSLLGTTNIFPGSGAVGAGTTSPASGYQMHIANGSGAGKLLIEGSTAAQVDFKKGSTAATVGFGTANNDFVVNPGANNTVLQYNGSPKLTLTNDGVNVAGTLNATNITGGFSPATMAVTTRMAVGQANVDASYAMRVNGQMSIAGGGLRIFGTIPNYQTCSGCKAYWNNGNNDWGGNNNYNATGLRLEGKHVDAQGYITSRTAASRPVFWLLRPVRTWLC